MSIEWHYSKAGQQFGPIASGDLKDLAAAGEIGPDDLVWNSTLTEWVPAQRVKGLTFSAAPMAVQAFSPAASTSPMPVAEATPVAGSALLAYQSPAATEPVVMSHRAIDLLARTRPWVLVAAIVMFLWVGLMILGGLVLTFVLGSQRGGPKAGAMVGLIYLAMGLVFAALPIYLTKYYTQIGNLKRLRRTADLENALDAQRAYWKYLGIMTLVIIGLYIVGIIFAMVAGIKGWL